MIKHNNVKTKGKNNETYGCRQKILQDFWNRFGIRLSDLWHSLYIPRLAGPSPRRLPGWNPCSHWYSLDLARKNYRKTIADTFVRSYEKLHSRWNGRCLFSCLRFEVVGHYSSPWSRSDVIWATEKTWNAKPCRTNLKIPSSDHKNEHKNIKKPCRTKEKRIKT